MAHNRTLLSLSKGMYWRLASLMSEMWYISLSVIGDSKTLILSAKDTTNPQSHTSSVAGMGRASCLNIRKCTSYVA